MTRYRDIHLLLCILLVAAERRPGRTVGRGWSPAPRGRCLVEEYNVGVVVAGKGRATVEGVCPSSLRQSED